jgi:hypothetical protein
MVRAEISYQGYRSAYNRKVAETVYHGLFVTCPKFLDKVNFKKRLEAVLTT